MEYEVNFSFRDVDGLLGGGEELADERAEVVERFNALVAPSGGYSLYDSLSVGEDCFVLDGRTFRCGTRIAGALQGATSAAVFAVTVGDAVVGLERKYNEAYDYIKAYWCDKLANLALGKVLATLKDELRDNVRKEGLQITSHWGPGYCGWDIREQEHLLPLSPAAGLGITLSSSMLMRPVKSMSGVLGVGREVIYKESGCADCRLDKCAYRSMKW